MKMYSGQFKIGNQKELYGGRCVDVPFCYPSKYGKGHSSYCLEGDK